MEWNSCCIPVTKMIKRNDSKVSTISRIESRWENRVNNVDRKKHNRFRPTFKSQCERRFLISFWRKNQVSAVSINRVIVDTRLSICSDQNWRANFSRYRVICHLSVSDSRYRIKLSSTFQYGQITQNGLAPFEKLNFLDTVDYFPNDLLPAVEKFPI